jgi:uncharacterized membrane protein
MDKLIFIGNLASTFYLTGLIWLVQLVQYPFFARVGAENFQQYHAAHTFWITPVVAPAMILELITSIFLIFYPPGNIDGKFFWLGLFLTLTVWLSTFFLQVPMHEKLATGFDTEAHRFLVNSNWIRTIAWSLRSVLVSFFLWKLIRL